VRRPTVLLLAVSMVLAAGAAADAASQLSVRMSFGPVVGSKDARDLRARGGAPSGSRLVVRFYRGSRQIALRRPRLRGGRYATSFRIRRTGEYRVGVAAVRPDGTRMRTSAELDYGPTAEAPSAPD